MIEALSEHLSAEQITAGTIVRDVSGRLSFFAKHEIDEVTTNRIETTLRKALGAYARPDRLVASGPEIGSSIFSDPTSYLQRVSGAQIRVVDRRLVGMDWLRHPALPAPPPPRIVFASLKGGVGRSTALSVAAIHLANKGKRVLVIDLDMEAPGISTILLDSQTLPQYGVVDALVENGLSGLDDAFMADLVGSSRLSRHLGRIDVIPAFGLSSRANPADVLGKLARAYTEDLDSQGNTLSILDQVKAIVDSFSEDSRYDAILLDARAGLHETAASAILGLGADVLFFGLNEEQTFSGYEALFSHFHRIQADTPIDWLSQITMVHAKATGTAEDHALFADRCKALFVSSDLVKMRNQIDAVFIPAEPFNDVPWEDDQVSDSLPELENSFDESQLIAILEDERFKHYSPQHRSELTLPNIYASSFGTFLDWIDETIAAAGEHGEG